MSAFDLVIFDLDGVLIDSEVISCGCLAEALAAHGLPLSVDEVMDRFLGRGFAEVVAHFAAHTGRAAPEALRADYKRRLVERFRAELRAMPHAAALLRHLSTPFCLASSSDPDRVRLSLGLAGLDAAFGERVFTASMVSRGKPAPDLFLLAAERMRAPPSRTLVIEDSISGVIAARAAGMTAWGFIGGSHQRNRDGRRRLAAAGAHRIFESLVEIHFEPAPLVAP